MNHQVILDLMKSILQRQGKDVSGFHGGANLRQLNFRSLDFSELCLRVETQIGRELNFDARALRSIITVKDVCDFVLRAIG